MTPTEYRDEELLDRWISGELTAPEEAELERRAGQDDELARVYAALRAAPEVDHADHLAAMRRRARPAAARRSLIPRYAAAAAAVVLLGLAVVLLPRLFSPQKTEIAMERTESTLPTPATDSRETAAPASSPTTPPPPPAAQSSAPAPSEPASTMASPAADAVVEGAATEAEADFADAAAANTATARRVPPPAPALEAPAVRPRFRTPSPALRKLASFAVSGRVSNEDGEPIAGAVVRRTGVPTGPETDSSGRFTLPYDATLSQIEVSHPGYETETVDVYDTTARLQISLTQLPETTARAQWRENADRALLGLPPAPRERAQVRPTEGYRALRDRLESGRPDSLAGVRVRVSFEVAADGTLSEFRFRGTNDRAVMDYVGNTLVETSSWQVVKTAAGQGDPDPMEPVRVYFTLRFE